MARSYWWQKVDNPDAVVAAVRRPIEDRRVRYSTVLQQAGLFRNEPEVLRGIMDKNVPLALAMNAFNAYSATKQQGVNKRISQAGFSATKERGVEESGYFNKSAEWDKENRRQEDDTSGVFGWLADRVLDVGQVAQTVGEGVAEGATWLYNRTVGAPLSAGYASDTGLDEAFDDASELATKQYGNAAGLGPAALGMGIVNYGEGLYRTLSGDVSDEQREDIERGGLNPDRLGDRINFYAQDFGEVRAPVSDSDVEWLKGLKQWSEADVDAAREIITSGAMEDLSRSFSALSPEAQDLITRASKDPKADQLLSAMGDTTQTTFGGRLIRAAAPDIEPGEWFGPGSVSRGVASAFADTVAMWHLDPAVLASTGYKAVRAARYGVGGLTAEKVDKTAQMLKASFDDHTPKGALAKRFDDAMQAADDIVTKGVSTSEAAKMRASWLRRFPGYDKTLDLLIGQRAGTVGPLRARTLDEAKGEVRHAAEAGRDVNPWVLDAAPEGKPLWQFTKEDGTKLTAEERAVQRARAAEELSTFIVMDAYASGRQIVGSRLLLPGQLSLNGKVRDRLAPMLEAFNRRDRSVLKQLKETGKGPIDLNGHVVTDDAGRWDQLINPESAEWLRNNYTFGITHAFARGWRNFEKTFSNKTILPSSPDSVKVYGQLVSQFLPKRQAQMVTTQYAAANPAQRWVMTRQTIGGLLNVMNLRNTPESQKIVDQLTKGLVPEGEYINGYKAGVREYYTTPDGNFIRVGDMKMPAAVHPWQLSEGVELPNWRELRGLANRSALMNAVTRTTDGQMANALVRAWKSSKVTTWSNMARQGLELELFTAWRDPAVFRELRKARKAVKSDVLNRKVNDRDLERLANAVNNLTPDDLHQLEQVRRIKPETYVSTVSKMLERDGFSPRMAETMARLGQDVDLTEYGEFLASGSERRVRHLAMVGPWDRVRKIRARRAEKKGGNLEDTPLSKHLDAELAQQMLEGAAKQFGSAAESYAWNMAERSTHVDRRRITDAAGRNISFSPVKIVNGYEYVQDPNAQLWAAELGRRQSDPIGSLAMRLIARRHLAEAEEANRLEEAANGGLPLYRRDVEGASLSATEKPHGVYYSVEREGFRTPHEDAGPVEYRRRGLDLAHEKVLNLTNEDVQHARFGEMESGPGSTGVLTLKKLVSEEEFSRLATLRKDALIDELSQKFPGPDYSKYYDSYELLEAYGAQLAREKGYVALHLPGEKGFEEFEEYVALADDAAMESSPLAGTQSPDLDALTAEALAGEIDKGLAIDASRLRSADDLVSHLYGEHELGASMRANAAALQYLPDGKPVGNPAEQRAAAQAAARRAVDDLVHHMGGKVTRTDKGASIMFPEGARPLLEKLAKGDELSAADLAKLPPEAKPEGLVAPIYAPMVPEKNGFTQGLSNLATRAYGAVVADPLDKLFIMPTFVAHRRLAQDEMLPLMDALTKKGMSPEQAAFMVESAVNKRAVAKTFQGTDNPMEKSVFSEMADKWLMFQRAQEDFVRRLLAATKANPEGLARANILMQAGVHSGIVHYEPFQDEEGNQEYHLTFTYPGTALAQRVMADAAVSLGLAPEEILRVPQFDGLKSQVRFINPGLSNPLQFSANPIFGFTMWGAEKVWPGATVELERLRRGFSGGQDFEGTQGPFEWKNMLPSMFTRFATFASKDDADGQFQSAMRAALMYAELSGQTPGPEASPSERARFLDAVKATTTNIMLQRAVFGAFLPASPQLADPDMGELDAIARAQGLPNLRSEFFDIRNELAKKYPDNFFRADSEAVAEFARRYPGELIVNPAAFSTSSTELAGNDEAYAPYTIEATKWLFENLDFVRANPTVAFALMPKNTADGDFSNEAYKLQFKSDIRTHKNIQEFYDDLVMSDDIDEFYRTRSQFFELGNSSPALYKSAMAKMDDWEGGWRRTHPLAAAELDRRADPNYVHAEIAPALGRLADRTDPLPQSMRKFLPQIKEMWRDYQDYRSAYAKVDYYDNKGRRDLNKQYQQQGDLKWLGASMSGMDLDERNALNADAGALSGLWDLMRVTEGR